MSTATASPSSAPRRGLLRRLDYLPTWLAIALGLALGGLAGSWLLHWAESWQWAAFATALALVAAAALLAWSSEPVAVLEEEQEEEEEDEDKPPDFEIPADLQVKMVPIPAGSFTMGSADDDPQARDDEKPAHPVTLAAFEMMATPVTRQLYQKVVGEDPGWPEGEADDRPVNQVSWEDAAEFCNQLSKLHRLQPAYLLEGDQPPQWQRDADGFRLPSEAEWEYACRAGTETPWSFGDNSEKLGKYAWYTDNSDNAPQPVGTKKPNPWALYDMHGNVWEWVWDWYGEYSAEAREDPSGPDEGKSRVLRGGSFFDPAQLLRSAIRFRGGPEFRDWLIGFRCVRSPRRQP